MRELLLLAPLLLPCAGCSATFMSAPPAGGASGQARPHVDCSSSYAWPIVDTVLASYQLAGVALAATRDDSDYDRYPISRRTDMALGVGFAAVFAASATYGYISATRCARIQRGPDPGRYVPGVSRADEAPQTARLISGGGASEMVRRPDPQGAVWKR
jgi:hypothetical protein